MRRSLGHHGGQRRALALILPGPFTYFRGRPPRVADVSITVAAIRRYPVKSMGGQRVRSVTLGERGTVRLTDAATNG